MTYISLVADGVTVDKIAVCVTDNQTGMLLSDKIPSGNDKTSFTGRFFGAENYTISDNGTEWKVEMDIYNIDMAYAVVDIYANDGSFVDSKIVKGKKLVTSVGEQLISTYEDIPKLPEILSAIVNNSPSYRTVDSELNNIEFNIPKGGYFVITMDANISPRVLLANMVNYYETLVDLLSEDPPDIVKEVLKDTLQVEEISEKTIMIANNKLDKMLYTLEKEGDNLTYGDLAQMVQDFNSIFIEIFHSALDKLNIDAATASFAESFFTNAVDKIVEELTKKAVAKKIAGSVAGGQVTFAFSALDFVYKLDKMGNFMFPLIELYKNYGKYNAVFVFTGGSTAAGQNQMQMSVPGRDNISSWALEGVESIWNNGFADVSLFSDYKKNITREEFAMLAVKLYEKATGYSVKITDFNKFSDISDSSYKEYILKANQLGIVNGEWFLITGLQKFKVSYDMQSGFFNIYVLLVQVKILHWEPSGSPYVKSLLLYI